MAVVAAQLEAVVSASGVDSTAAQLAAMGAAADEAGASLAGVSASGAASAAGLDAAAGSGIAAGAGLDDLAASADAAAGSLAGADGALSGTAGAADSAAAGLASADAALASTATSADAAAASLQGTAAAEQEAGDEGSGLFEKIGGPLQLIGLAALAAGAMSVKMAGDFQESMTQLVTGAGESESNLNMVSQGILNMAVSTGTSTKDLSDGMYMIESSGQHGAQALQTLTIAAEAAKVGTASLADVANGVTTAMTDYASSNLTAAQAANTLIATVAAGKTHMQDLSQALSTILPVASSVGVSFNNVMASMATMTGEGVPAADAATYLRQMLMALENPATKGAAALKSIGLTSGEVASEMKKSLPGALQMITEHLAKKFPVGSQAYIAALSAISGGTKQMQGMLDLTGTHLKTFQNNVKTIAGSVKQGGNSVTGWSKVQQDFNFKMAQAGQILQTGMIRAGTALMPIVENLVGGFVSFVGTMSGFVSWLNKGSAGADIVKGVLIALAGAALGFVASAIPALVAGFIAWATAAGAAAVTTLLAAAPFIAVGAAIALLVAGIVLAIQHWGAIVQFFSGLWHTVWGAVSSFFVGIWTSVVGFFEGVFARFKGIFIALGVIMAIVFAPLILAIAALAAPFVGLYLLFTHFHQVLQFTQNLARVVWQAILNAILAPIHLIGAAFEWLYAHNIYFQKLVDAIRNILTAGIAWIRGIWQDVIGWIVARWDYLKQMATIYFAALYVEIQSKIQQVENFIHSIWEAILSYLQGRWQAVVSLAQSLWGKVTGVFQAAWSEISGALHSLWSNIVSFVSGWPAQAVQWGINLIKGLINGILSMVGSVGNAVGSIAKKIGSFLGFHSPTKEGEGRQAATWAPAFVSMYTAGLLAGIPKIAAAAQKLMKPIAVSLNPSASLSGGMSSTMRPLSYLPPQQQYAPQTGAGQGQPLILQIDGRQFARVIMPLIVSELRYKVGVMGK